MLILLTYPGPFKTSVLCPVKFGLFQSSSYRPRNSTRHNVGLRVLQEIPGTSRPRGGILGNFKGERSYHTRIGKTAYHSLDKKALDKIHSKHPLLKCLGVITSHIPADPKHPHLRSTEVVAERPQGGTVIAKLFNKRYENCPRAEQDFSSDHLWNQTGVREAVDSTLQALNKK